MDQRVMELRIKQWIPVMDEQAKSGLSKTEWCTIHGVDRTTFFRWQKRVRTYLLDQCPILPTSPLAEETGFVEVSPTQASLVKMTGQAQRCAEDPAVCPGPPSLNIRYRDFSIDLSNGVDEEQLSRVLRAIKHAD